MFVFDSPKIRFGALIMTALLAGRVNAQLPNFDASTLFAHSNVTGTARVAGAGGAFSSVGADLGSLELNPAGLGIYRSSDIAITPGLRVAADNSDYNGTSAKASHTILQFEHAGAVLTKKMADHSKDGVSKPFALKFISIGINYQTENSFDRSQNFGMLNNSHSLIDNYAFLSNKYYQSSRWSLESYIFSLANIIGQNPVTGSFTSNVKAPVQQSGSLSTSGATHRISLGLGGNVGDKLFFGFSLSVPILNYSVSAQMSETNANPNDSITHFQYYNLSSNVTETGVGVTGKLGLIYKPVPWMRFGVSYSLPTWYFITENNSGDLIYQFDTILASEYGPGSLEPYNYKLRTPMKGTVGASFYFKEHGFISVDYDFQNLGSMHYTFSDSAALLNSSINHYLKTVYGYSHTARIGGEAAIKKFRIRAGYSFTSSPFKKGQNYTDAAHDASIHSATLGMGLKFKSLYLDLAYIFSYTKDGLMPNYTIPLDQINSTYMTHNLLLTIGFKIGAKGDKNNSNTPAKTRQRNNGELPKYIDPGDKSY